GDVVELVADVPATVTGHVVRRDTGEPVKGAMIHVYVPVSEQRIREATSDESGGYSFTGLPAGRVSLSTWIDGFAGQWDDVTVEAGEAKRHEVSLGRGVVITGKVVDAETGSPIEGARVGGPERSVPTDAAGAFTMAGLEPRANTL